MRRQVSAARWEILLLLRRSGSQTVDALSAAMGITPVGVRKHLDTLEIDGLVHPTTVRRPRGRPAQVYSLTEAADDLFPKAYHAALSSVLRQVREIGGEELLDRVMAGRCLEQEAAFLESAAEADSLEARVALLVGLRNEEGYMAEWQRDDGRLIFSEYNCALSRAARQFPHFCASEMDLVRRILGDGVEVERTECMVSGDRRCTYVIRERPTRA